MVCKTFELQSKRVRKFKSEVLLLFLVTFSEKSGISSLDYARDHSFQQPNSYTLVTDKDTLCGHQFKCQLDNMSLKIHQTLLFALTLSFLRKSEIKDALLLSSMSWYAEMKQILYQNYGY